MSRRRWPPTKASTTAFWWPAWSGASSPRIRRAPQVRIFFLCCVIVAGLYGSLTVTRRILYIQALPAAAALALVLAA